MARPRQFTDEQLLQVARRCFLEHGPAVSTRQIAERLGVSQAALFKRFGTKDQLMMAALAPPEVPEWSELAEAGPVAGDVRAQLVSLLVAATASFQRHFPCISTLRASGMSQEALLDRYEVPPPVRALTLLSGWLERGQVAGWIGGGDPVAAAGALLGSLHMQIFLSHISRQPGPSAAALEELASSVVDLLWRGLAPDSDAPVAEEPALPADTEGEHR